MNQLPAEFHPEAVDEAQAAREWYAQRSTDAAIAFLAELDKAVECIEAHPERWPMFLFGTRHYVMRQFSFVVVYRVVEVVAVAHSKRQPGYWQARLSD